MARAGGITNAVNVGIAVQADWENREFISNISLNVRRLFDFLVQFGTCLFPHFGMFFLSSIFPPEYLILESTTKNKLAKLNEKMDTLERRLEILEVQVSNATANPGLFTPN
ncbi:protein BRICK 1-like [Dorcoceras hygrometricum]|uniref:Protein BRICK 1-like n=1 Tax=Dorcoceras hygrometricum TaxID=472368 RepID=A0A2Z7CC50_9LAMI|nr:protein BRICK 1-like [Dorcoceras hygrometricum]